MKAEGGVSCVDKVADDEGARKRGVAAEVDFVAWREPANGVAVRFSYEESCFRQVVFCGDFLQACVVGAIRQTADCGWIACEELVCKSVYKIESHGAPFSRA